MKMFWGNVKFYGLWWSGWFAIAVFMDGDIPKAAASATGSLLLPFGFLWIWMVWEESSHPTKRHWGQDIDGGDEH